MKRRRTGRLIKETLTHRGSSRAEVRRAATSRASLLRRWITVASDTWALGQRFRQHGREYSTFLEHAGAAPTNNRTEQAIRFVVRDRKATQGTRGQRGQRWCERIWSILGTCRLQDHSAFHFLVQTLQHHFQRIPTPNSSSSTVSSQKYWSGRRLRIRKWRVALHFCFPGGRLLLREKTQRRSTAFPQTNLIALEHQQHPLVERAPAGVEIGFSCATM